MKVKVLFVLFFVVFSNFNYAQIRVGNDNLLINIQENGDAGVELQSILNNGNNVLEDHSYLFFLYLTDLNNGSETRISATTGWGKIDVNNNGSHCKIHFSNPLDGNLPSTLNVNLDLLVLDKKSEWDLSVNGVGNNHTLTRVNFPKFKVKTNINDAFFIPKFSGVLIDNPLSSNIDYDLTYPRGRLGASMPFAAYINRSVKDASLYFGFHDSGASLKNLVIKAEKNYIKYYGKHSIPNKTLANNNWELPGVFEFEIYDGGWYESAMIYKSWASENASYFPDNSSDRNKRQHSLGEIAVWGSLQPALTRPLTKTENDINSFINMFPPNIKVGIHWYKWNNQYHDDKYPNFFPERDGFVPAVQKIQQNGNTVMPYLNGMIYDTDLPDYKLRGFPYATKKNDTTAYTVVFGDFEPGATNSIFAFMCPTQMPWRSRIIDAFSEHANRIQTNGVYVDMVGWAGATECMDIDHGHPLASGHWWHDGTAIMFNQIHESNPNTFVTVEGATDNLTQVVDGFLANAWLTDNMVPAFQTIYGGKNQFFGTKYGGSKYNSPSFYSKFSNSFVNNIQPGRYYLYFAKDPNALTARNFIIDLVTMRYKLRKFMSYGEMLKPFDVVGDISDITSNWGNGIGDVTVSALQRNSFINVSKDTIAVVFSNASMTKSLEFSFLPSDIANYYNVSANYDIIKITPSSNGAVFQQNGVNPIQVVLAPMKTIAYMITHHSNGSGVEQILLKDNVKIYPNPASDKLNIIVNDEVIKSIEVLDITGKIVISINHDTRIIDISKLYNGIYTATIYTDKKIYQTKFVKN